MRCTHFSSYQHDRILLRSSGPRVFRLTTIMVICLAAVTMVVQAGPTGVISVDAADAPALAPPALSPPVDLSRA